MRIFAADQTFVRSYCTLGDPVCNYSAGNLAPCAAALYCPHLHYVDLHYTAAASEWILGRLEP